MSKSLSHKNSGQDASLQLLCEIIKTVKTWNYFLFWVLFWYKRSRIKYLPCNVENLLQKITTNRYFPSLLTSVYNVNTYKIFRSRRVQQTTELRHKTVSRYFVPFKFQIADLPSYHTIGLMFCPLFVRFLKTISMDNFQRWYKT